MNNITSGMANMSVQRPTTPRNQGTRPVNVQPHRDRTRNTGRGGPGKKLHFGYQQNQPGGKRKKSRKGGKRRRKKSRKRRRKGGVKVDSR